MKAFWAHRQNYVIKCLISAKKWCIILLLKPKQLLFNVEIVRRNMTLSFCWSNPRGLVFLHYSKIVLPMRPKVITPIASTHWHIPHPNISYPAFSIHFTFALLQDFLERRLVSLATEFLLSSDTDTWWPSGCKRFRQASHIVSSFYIYGLNIKLKHSDIFFSPMRPRTNQKTLQSNKEQLNQCWFKAFHCAVTERITKRQRDRKRENTTD